METTGGPKTEQAQEHTLYMCACTDRGTRLFDYPTPSNDGGKSKIEGSLIHDLKILYMTFSPIHDATTDLDISTPVYL